MESPTQLTMLFIRVAHFPNQKPNVCARYSKSPTMRRAHLSKENVVEESTEISLVRMCGLNKFKATIKDKYKK